MGFPAKVFLGLGSNLGDRMSFLQMAVDLLAENESLDVCRSSPVYETDPWGVLDQPKFLNAVVEIECRLLPEELLTLTKEVEAKTGRSRRIERWVEREIDIDVLVFGEMIIVSNDFNVPHPNLLNRVFVLKPFSDIAADLNVPGANITISEALVKCPDTGKVQLYWETLRI